MSAPDVVYVERRATLPEHRELAASVDWLDHFDWETIPASLGSSLHGVVAVVGDEVVGMGRLVGDGVHYFYVQDVIVRPEYSDSGIGSGIVERLLDWIAATAPSRAFVGLFSSDEAQSMYESHGFATERMTGMHRFVDPEPTVP
jgi:GNAT superfamily N-acetyltransferase